MQIRAAALGVSLVLAVPAFGQECATQYPPSFNGNMAPIGPCNSLPSGAATARVPTFGGDLVTTPLGASPPAALSRSPGVSHPITPEQEPVLRGSE